MAEPAVGDRVTLSGTIMMIDGDIAVVRVDGAPEHRGLVVVRLGAPPGGGPSESDEDRIRDAMAGAQDHPGRTITR